MNSVSMHQQQQQHLQHLERPQGPVNHAQSRRGNRATQNGQNYQFWSPPGQFEVPSIQNRCNKASGVGVTDKEIPIKPPLLTSSQIQQQTILVEQGSAANTRRDQYQRKVVPRPRMGVARMGGVKPVLTSTPLLPSVDAFARRPSVEPEDDDEPIYCEIASSNTPAKAKVSSSPARPSLGLGGAQRRNRLPGADGNHDRQVRRQAGDFSRMHLDSRKKRFADLAPIQTTDPAPKGLGRRAITQLDMRSGVRPNNAHQASHFYCNIDPASQRVDDRRVRRDNCDGVSSDFEFSRHPRPFQSQQVQRKRT